ncbi:MAG TPA: FHA domain-containing protein [Kofleriaceae bacterium]|nr:FHA domain-containing protein [Kofleriaceae bacterium]
MSAEELVARVQRLAGLVPEQVTSDRDDADTDAALADQWARLHRLPARAVIGRDADNEVAVSQASVSRRHAELRFDAARATWTVTDLGSRNGTFVEGARLAPNTPAAIGDRQLLQVGEVGFVFVLDRRTLPAARVTESYRATVESGGAPDRVRLSPPTTEGAGMVTRGDQTITLGSAQFSLLWMLAERLIATRDQPAEIRGFVRSIELLTDLPWNTPSPDDNHLKQQIRRVRKALARLGLEDAIEARHGFGYRLTIEPLLGA